MNNLRIYILLALSLIGTMAINASDIKGDLNDDGKLSIADVSVFSDILLGKITSALSTSLLDFNSDGTINIGDLTKLINIVANSSESGLDVGIEGWDDSGEDWGGTLSAPNKSNGLMLSCAEATLLENDIATLAIALRNPIDVNAFLMTIQVPDGLSFSEINFTYCMLARNPSSSVLDYNMTSDGKLKVISYSTDNSTFTGSEGDILLVNVQATTAKDFALGVSNAEFSNADFSTLYVQDVNPSASAIIRTIAYYVDGELYQTQTYEYGATVEPLPHPEKEGYVFSGWSEIPETMPAYDINVYGSFESGIEDIVATKNNLFDIYTLQGLLIKKQASSISDLRPGMYIINRKKVFIDF